MINKSVDYLGEGNPCWRGGKMNPKCSECGTKISYGNTRCYPCSTKSSAHNWKGGITLKEGYTREYDKLWRIKNRTRKNFLNHKRRLIKMEIEGSHTLEEWEELKKTYGYMCLCCKRIEPEITLTEDHIIPLSLEGTDYIWNIQPLCKSCNSIKRTKTINYRMEVS